MATYYGTTRTNYVAVKDASEFKKFLEDIICIGVIEGNITVALWDDEYHCGG